MPNDIALSFVENKFDLVEINDLKKTYNFSIISKIETQKGIKNIEDIIENTLKISSANEKQTKNT